MYDCTKYLNSIDTLFYSLSNKKLPYAGCLTSNKNMHASIAQLNDSNDKRR